MKIQSIEGFSSTCAFNVRRKGARRQITTLPNQKPMKPYAARRNRKARKTNGFSEGCVNIRLMFQKDQPSALNAETMTMEQPRIAQTGGAGGTACNSKKSLTNSKSPENASAHMKIVAIKSTPQISDMIVRDKAVMNPAFCKSVCYQFALYDQNFMFYNNFLLKNDVFKMRQMRAAENVSNG